MSSLAEGLGKVLRSLLKEPSIVPRFRDQFRPQEGGANRTARNLNAAFLISLTGERLSYPARGYLSSMNEDPDWGTTASFYLHTLDLIATELSGTGLEDIDASTHDLYRRLETFPDDHPGESVARFWGLFAPRESTPLADQGGDDLAAGDIPDDGRSMKALFGSRLPVTAACLRVALTAAIRFASGTEAGRGEGEDLVRRGTGRLAKAIGDLEGRGAAPEGEL